MYTLILSAWGASALWDEVKYRLEADGIVISRSSRTSLATLWEYAGRRGSERRVLVIAPESLLAPIRPERTLEDAGGEYPDFCQVGSSAGSDTYRRLLSGLREAIRRTVSKLAGIDVGHVDVGVSPSVGTYRHGNCDNVRFHWEIDDGVGEPFGYYQSTAYLHVIHNLPVHPTRIRMIVDLTHGINYTSTALYRVAMDSARLYSAATLEDVEIEVYNSEPYVKGAKELKMWRIRKLRITPKAAASRLVYTSIAYEKKRPSNPRDVLRTSTALTGSVRKNLYIRLPGEPKATQYGLFEAPLIGGFPLLLLQAGAIARRQLVEPPWSSFRKVAGMLLDSLPIVKIYRGNGPDGHWHIKHLAALNYRNLKSYYASLALRSYARNVFVRVMGGSQHDILLYDACEGVPRVFATVKALEETTDKYLATPNVYIVHYELSKLKSMTGGGDLYDRYRMAQYCGPREYKPPRSTGNPDRRIFTAHAGLNNDLVSVLKPENSNKVYLGYTCDSLKGVEDTAKDIISKLRENIINY